MLGRKTIAADLRRDMDDDSAVLAMIETNLRQRPKLLPSERAAAYRMMRDTLAHKGDRSDLTGAVQKNTREQISEMYGESPRQVARYIRLACLDERLLPYVDDGKLKLNSAVEISFLEPHAQGWIVDHYAREYVFPKPSQIREMRKLADEGRLTQDAFDELMQEKTPVRADPDDFFADLRGVYFPGLTDEDTSDQNPLLPIPL